MSQFAVGKYELEALTKRRDELLSKHRWRAGLTLAESVELDGLIEKIGARVENLSFEGDGRISVDANALVKSEKVQEQVRAVREFASGEGKQT